MNLKNSLHGLIKLYEQNGLFRIPLSDMNSRLHMLVCPKKNILTVQDSSKKASQTEFSCKKITHLPFTNITTSPLLKYKIKTGEYVAVNPTAPPSEIRYIESALKAAISTVDFLSEESENSSTSLNIRICDIYQYIQKRPEESISLIENEQKKVLILRNNNSLMQAIPIYYKKLEDGECKNKFSSYTDVSFKLLTSFYNTNTNTRVDTKFPVVYFGEAK